MMSLRAPLDGVTVSLAGYIETVRSNYLERFLTLALHQWLRGCLVAEDGDFLQRIGLAVWLQRPDDRCVAFDCAAAYGTPSAVGCGPRFIRERCSALAGLGGGPESRPRTGLSSTCLLETHVAEPWRERLQPGF